MATTIPPPCDVENILANRLQHLCTDYDTPSARKHGDSIAGQYGKTDDARNAAILDAGPDVPEVDVSKFLDNVLPRPPKDIEDHLEDIVKKLEERDGTRPAAYARERWTAFPKDPSKSGKKEDQTFAALVKIANSVAEAALPYSQDGLVCTFKNDGASIPTSVWRQSTTRPDGYFVLVDRKHPTSSTGQYHWMDIAATGEYKKDNNIETRNDDNLKAIWNMHHTLREDPRRRFTFAFTIENTTMRLWYASRSEILVSEPIDVMKNCVAITRFFLSFMFSTTTSMGWDPTMEYFPASNDEDGYYTIEVHPGVGKPVVIYRTLKLISDVGTNATRGRGTRVWKVVKDSDPKGRPSVLKDSWIDSNRQREGDILHTLRSTEDLTANQRLLLENCFLTVQNHGDVLIDSAPDTTLTESIRESLTEQARRFILDDQDNDQVKAHIERMSKTAGGTGSHSTPQEFLPKPQAKSSTYRSKTRYRIVFNEYCERLSDEHSLDKILQSLGTVCLALQCLHELGWVHRDVSAANILLYTEEVSDKGSQSASSLPSSKTVKTRVILADLEYAKKMGASTISTKRDDVRTGTADFMAVEVYMQRYLFRSARKAAVIKPRGQKDLDIADILVGAKPCEDVDDEDDGRIDQNTADDLDTSHAKRAGQLVFFFNPIHDLESVWWIAAYFLFNKDVELKGSPIPQSLIEPAGARAIRVGKQIKFARSLFYYGDERKSVFADELYFEEQLDVLHPAVAAIGHQLEEARLELVKRYSEVENSSDPITCNAARDLHGSLRERLTRNLRGLQKYNVQVQVPPCTPRKKKPSRTITAPAQPVASGSRSKATHGLEEDNDCTVEPGAVRRNNPFARPSKKPKLSHPTTASRLAPVTRARSKASVAAQANGKGKGKSVRGRKKDEE